jgi:hypothetical protein
VSDTPFNLLPAVDFSDGLIFGAESGGVSRSVTGETLHNSWGLDFLGSKVLTSGAHETGVLTLTFGGVPATRDCLFVFVRVASYGGTPDPLGDIASLRFNADSGANYWTRHLWFDAGTWNDVPNASTTLIRLAESNSRLSRNVIVKINNLATRGKTCNMKNQTGTANAATVGAINIAGGEWVNLVDQITSIQLINAGSNNMGAGSGFAVFGVDF